LSIAANFYQNDREKMIGLIEAAAAGGMMLGPLIGTALFSIGGYVFMLSSFGAVFLVLTAFLPCLFPKFLDYTNL
jgi:MFS family permease